MENMAPAIAILKIAGKEFLQDFVSQERRLFA